MVFIAAAPGRSTCVVALAAIGMLRTVWSVKVTPVGEQPLLAVMVPPVPATPTSVTA